MPLCFKSGICLLFVFFLSHHTWAQQPGSLDFSFDPGISVGNIGGAHVGTSAIQADGRILIAGQFTSYQGEIRTNIVRLNSDGSIDPTFTTGPAPQLNLGIYDIVIQPDLKILICGNFTSYNGANRNGVARLNSDGTLDTSFDPGSGFSGFMANTAREMALQPDGKIVLVGDFDTYNGIARKFVARINSDGSLDNSFDPGPGIFHSLNASNLSACAILPDGKIIIGGSFDHFSFQPIHNVARLFPDGSLDTSFNSPANIETIEAIAIQIDGKILVGGISMPVVRLNLDGSYDTGFNSGFAFSSWAIHDLVIQPDNKIVIVGLFTEIFGVSRNRIARLHSNGSLDVDFDPGTGANNQIHTVSLQADNKLVIGGWFNEYNGVQRNLIARLHGGIPGPCNLDFSLGADTALCHGQQIILNPGIANAYYTWQNGANTPSFMVSESGTYWANISIAGCTGSDTIEVIINSIPEFSLGQDTTLCKGQILSLQPNVFADTFTWHDGSTSTSYSVTETGNYWVTAINANCSYTDSIAVLIQELPTFDLGNDSSLCAEAVITLNPNISNATYHWQNGSANSILTTNQSGNYWVEVTQNGCKSRDEINLEFIDCTTDLVMPNIFTPNQDAINDTFTPILFKNIVSMKTIILNRWGQKVFETDRLPIEWNGQTNSPDLAPDGLYYYFIEYMPMRGNLLTKKGWVNLVR